MTPSDVARRSVAVVTGGANGIGAAIALELGRQGHHVVTVDPVVSVDGGQQEHNDDDSTAARIRSAGGQARASDVSVTDAGAIRNLFDALVDEFGALHIVINVAGISRPTNLRAGSEDDWNALLSVHLNGYLNVLKAALPHMAKAGYGRIVGVTSGSGWRAADAGGYSAAKRAVAALTWQLGRVAPAGVTINAMSPIAATRMVWGALSRSKPGDESSSGAPASGGLALGALPPPESLGPVGAYLAGDRLSWCSGQVLYCGGSELAWITPPQLLEAASTKGSMALPRTIDTLMSGAFGPAERTQATSGGSTPRFPELYAQPDGAPRRDDDPVRRTAENCLVITDDDDVRASLAEALAARGMQVIGPPIGTPLETSFADASGVIARAAAACGGIGSAVIALSEGRAAAIPASEQGSWQRVLGEHTGLAERLTVDAAWMRAVVDCSVDRTTPLRLVIVTQATSAGGRSRAQAVAQLARAGRLRSDVRVDIFPISCESMVEAARVSLAVLVGHLLGAEDAGEVSGAELVIDTDWLGIRSHPRPAATLTYPAPDVPQWVDGALRSMIR